MPHIETQAIEARLSEIKEAVAALETEASELEIALRIMNKYALVNRVSYAEPAKDEADAKDTKLGPPRPEGIPTNFEMADLILRSAELEGKNGLTANEIVEMIRQRYWPGVEKPQILPTIYQFAKKGRIHKTPSGKFKAVRRLVSGDIVGGYKELETAERESSEAPSAVSGGRQ